MHDDCCSLFSFILFLFVMTQTLDTRTVTEDLTVGPTITSGGVYLATNSSRTGLINIGHESSSGVITIDAGSSELVLGGAFATVPNTVNATTATADADLFDNVTSGNTGIVANSARTGTVNIGHASSSGIITVNAGSSKLNLNASNFVSGIATMGISDESGNDATVEALLYSDYQRVDKIVFVTMEIHVTSLAGMTGTDEMRITGLPFAHHAGSDEHDLGSITGTGFTGVNYTDISVFGIPGTTTCHVRGTRFVNSANNPILISDLAIGSFRCFLAYFTETGA